MTVQKYTAAHSIMAILIMFHDEYNYEIHGRIHLRMNLFSSNCAEKCPCKTETDKPSHALWNPICITISTIALH